MGHIQTFPDCSVHQGEVEPSQPHPRAEGNPNRLDQRLPLGHLLLVKAFGKRSRGHFVGRHVFLAYFGKWVAEAW